MGFWVLEITDMVADLFMPLRLDGLRSAFILGTWSFSGGHEVKILISR